MTLTRRSFILGSMLPLLACLVPAPTEASDKPVGECDDLVTIGFVGDAWDAWSAHGCGTQFQDLRRTCGPDLYAIEVVRWALEASPSVVVGIGDAHHSPQDTVWLSGGGQTLWTGQPFTLDMLSGLLFVRAYVFDGAPVPEPYTLTLTYRNLGRRSHGAE